MKKLKKQQSLSISKPWIKFYDEGVPKTIDYPDKMLWEFISDSAKNNPNDMRKQAINSVYGNKSPFGIQQKY